MNNKTNIVMESLRNNTLCNVSFRINNGFHSFVVAIHAMWDNLCPESYKELIKLYRTFRVTNHLFKKFLKNNLLIKNNYMVNLYIVGFIIWLE